MENVYTALDSRLSTQEPVFSPELEKLLSDYGNDFPKQSLKRFLSVQTVQEMTEELLEDEEWQLLETAISAIFLEEKDNLLNELLGTFGNYIYNHYEQTPQIEKTLVEGFCYASDAQLVKGLDLLDKLEMQFDYSDDFEIAIFYRNVKKALHQNQQITIFESQMESVNYQPMSSQLAFVC